MNFLMFLMKRILDFLFTDLFQHSEICLAGLCTLWWVFYSWAWVRGDVKSSVLWNGLFQKKTIRRCWGHKLTTCYFCSTLGNSISSTPPATSPHPCLFFFSGISKYKTQPKYKTINVPNLRKRLLRDINWNHKQIGIWKCYLVGL